MSNIQLNYAFVVFWIILAVNWLKTSLFGQKIYYLSKNYPESLFFSTELKQYKSFGMF